MTKVTLKIPKSSDAKLLLAFAERLNAIVIDVDITDKKETPTSAFYWLEELSKIGGLDSISDPVNWQREKRRI